MSSARASCCGETGSGRRFERSSAPLNRALPGVSMRVPRRIANVLARARQLRIECGRLADTVECVVGHRPQPDSCSRVTFEMRAPNRPRCPARRADRSGRLGVLRSGRLGPQPIRRCFRPLIGLPRTLHAALRQASRPFRRESIRRTVDSPLQDQCAACNPFAQQIRRTSVPTRRQDSCPLPPWTSWDETSETPSAQPAACH